MSILDDLKRELYLASIEDDVALSAVDTDALAERLVNMLRDKGWIENEKTS